MNFEWLLERQLSWISQADSKLSVLGPLPLAMLAISLSGASVDFGNFSWMDVPVFMSTILLSVSLLFAKWALSPKLDGPEASVIFFGRIAESTAEDFAKQVMETDEASFRQDILKQVHRNALIAQQKHRNIRLSIFWLACATPLWLLSVALEF
ncbi:Pycsar system effector family protein [Loktanella agnita]|uniref:Pycsar system effector family protein n=1 Tax=Loktanella agnita TaxID=287097 RepID=UPI00398576B4